ncbi:DinB family protein [Christiangramia sp.]|uniref:DinB family protein n=1 Tax=Christiangramia sp. TaxID=1931228 RepID=UPI00262C3632|nr:DinB family protein [Christiangramia sp.]
MKKFILTIIIFLISWNSFSQESDYLEAFLKKWDNSKEYLLDIAELMPEEYYSFKPTERQLSFSGQLEHINQNMTWINSDYIQQNKELDKTEFPTIKADIIKEISKSFDLVSENVKNLSDEKLKQKMSFFSGEMNLLQILNLIQDHVTHHRGQLIVYLNLKGIEPPPYRGW